MLKTLDFDSSCFYLISWAFSNNSWNSTVFDSIYNKYFLLESFSFSKAFRKLSSAPLCSMTFYIIIELWLFCELSISRSNSEGQTSFSYTKLF